MMGNELAITEELVNTNTKLSEISEIATIINSEIKNETFITPFNEMIEEIAKCYDVLIENIMPFAELNNKEDFLEKFDEMSDAYKERYLKEISKPRLYSDEAYEQYLLLQTMKECKTTYPLLKTTFKRLDQFIDKWITNDAWLAMGIDNLFKRLPRLLNKVAETKQIDPSDAFIVYQTAFNEFKLFLESIKTKRHSIGQDITNIPAAM